MSGSINEVLRGIVDRHGRILLDDHRRCESCLRDSSLTPKEISGLLGALKVGIPKRIAAVPSIGEKGVANFAAELSETSGLSEQVAQTSVQAWAFALRQQAAEITKEEEDKEEENKKDETVGSKASVPSLSEAIVAAIVIPVICYGAYVFGTFKVFGFEVPAWIFALIVVVKGGQSIGSYLSFRFGTKA